MPPPAPVRVPSPRSLALLAALALCGVFTLASYAAWASFSYTTFDLAFYVQALWGAWNGHWTVSLLGVPMLGNHADAIVFLLLPLFKIAPHPFLPVLVQNLALVLLVSAGYRYARELGFAQTPSAWMSLALVLAPATGFAALHEFHPETLAAPFLMLLALARLQGRAPAFWVWFLLALACKENIALLLGWWFAVETVLSRKRGMGWLARWCLAPMAVAWGWAFLYLLILAPRWNAGGVDFAALYGPLGDSLPAIALSPILNPGGVLDVLSRSLQGNFLPGLLLPFLLLPLLRPKWVLVALPLIAQHLLSFRASEWTIHFHYAIPLVPLFWIGAAEALARRPRLTRPLAPAMAAACLVAGMYYGLFPHTVGLFSQGRSKAATSERTDALLERIPPDAAVIASLPLQSHLATRGELHSLHHLLKGLRTLGTERYTPPQSVDAVVVDFSDRWTFDVAAGFYHPAMETRDGAIVPSSDQLAHAFLRGHAWEQLSADAVTLYLRREEGAVEPRQTIPVLDTPMAFDATTDLVGLGLAWGRESGRRVLRVATDWQLRGERTAIPWLRVLVFDEAGQLQHILQRGWCAPYATSRAEPWRDEWTATWPENHTAGFVLRLEWLDKTREAREEIEGRTESAAPEIVLALPSSAFGTVDYSKTEGVPGGTPPGFIVFFSAISSCGR